MDMAIAFLVSRENPPADFDEAAFFEQFSNVCPDNPASQLIPVDKAVLWLERTVSFLPAPWRYSHRVEHHAKTAIETIKEFIYIVDGIDYVPWFTTAKIIWREMIKARRELSK